LTADGDDTSTLLAPYNPGGHLLKMLL